MRRNAAIARVSRPLMIDLFRELLQLPEGVTLEHIAEDPATDCWVLALAGEGLPACEEGRVPETVRIAYYVKLEELPGGITREHVSSIKLTGETGSWSSEWVVE